MILNLLKIMLGIFFLLCSYKSYTINQPLYALITAYALGSIPFGLLVTRLFTGKNISLFGSGNIGATNVLRSGNKMLAAITLILDVLKGTLAVFIGSAYSQPDSANLVVLLAGSLAILGHIFPVWLNFKGGKGIATILGVVLSLSWSVTFISIIVWLLTAKLTRISSLAGLVSVSVMPITAAFVENNTLALFLLGLTVLIYIRHIDNIKRLFMGKEPYIGECR